MEQKIIAEKHIKDYYEKMMQQVGKQIEAAKKAKAVGKDVKEDIETIPAMDLADRTENIIGPKGIAKRFREVNAEMKGDRIKTIFRLFEEMIRQEWCSIPDQEKRIEQAVKTALVLVTEGVVVAPLDGVPSIKISRNFDGSRFVDIYFAGPIRAAGGTATVFPLILGDYARHLENLDRYKPTEDEIERYVEEIEIYDEIVSRQYKLSADEVRKIIRGCPVCVNGEPTEEREANVHRDLQRVASNRVRGGMCLVVTEGIGLKAAKILTYSKMLKLDWNWLQDIIKVTKSGESSESINPNFKFLTRIAAGRPIFAYPSRSGGFRLRYGRGRNTSIMGKAIHPATMFLLDEFVAVGTQVKIERPGKSAEIFPCDTVEGPIVKLNDGEVLQIKNANEALELKNRIEKILFLGDMLITIGDFRKSAHPLMPVGYCSEWWSLEVEKATAGKNNVISTEIMESPDKIDPFTAVEISMEFEVPLHPKFLHYYKALSKSELFEFIDEGRRAKKIFDGDQIVEAIFENNPKTKAAMEKIGLAHKVSEKGIVVAREFAYPLLKTIGAFSEKKPDESKDIMQTLTDISGIQIRDKGGTFIGARMGRPEAARPRKMIGNPNVLFPIGFAGGNTRSINKAMEFGQGERAGSVEVELELRKCPSCARIIGNAFCPDCKKRTEIIMLCQKCGRASQTEQCGHCGGKAVSFNKRKVNVRELVIHALSEMKVKMPDIVKGVKGLINEGKIAEPIEKGILRASHGLHIFRDGTIRYELLNAPLTHFKAREIGTAVEKLREMGYSKDIDGNELENEEQLLELMPQDIIVNEGAISFLYDVTKFIDEELEKFYGIDPFFRKSSKEEIIGEFVLGLAPHTSAAIVGRIIGFTKARVCFAHPFYHLCKRRNADGDQDSVMLLMDALLNFSQSYLPGSRGGRMDAPLVFTIVMNPNEIDDEAHEIETCSKYPLELYEESQKFANPNLDSIPIVKKKLGKTEQYSGIGFTHDTTTFDEGPKISNYVRLGSMEEKIKSQAELQGRIAAVDKRDALERVMVSHFLPDIIGNARSFSRQNFRCTSCNTKYRRIPLTGKCTSCAKGNIILTIAEGSVIKYLKIAKEMTAAYGLSPYLSQRIGLIEQEISSVFRNDKVKQKSLGEFA